MNRILLYGLAWGQGFWYRLSLLRSCLGSSQKLYTAYKSVLTALRGK